MRVEESIFIDRPPEAVFGLLSVRSNDPVWMALVTEFEPGRRIARRSVAGAMEIATACIAEPAGTGCRATVVYEPLRLPGGVVGRSLAPLTARMVHRNFRADLARLKDLLEADARAAR